MGTLVETDIDNFIRGHKNKLQDERNNLSDKVRYVGAQSNSPRGRRQWDKQNQQGTRPAEQTQGGSTGQDRTGLRVGDSVEVSRKQQQLQQERQKEYNELLAQTGPNARARPPTPQEEGLPLGQYEKTKKALDQERGKEMREAMSKKKGQGKKMFDYSEAEKIHMDEKRREYNEYLQKQNNRHRHIITPEDGMFVGPDQQERDRQIREKSLQNKQQLEKREYQQKARSAGQGYTQGEAGYDGADPASTYRKGPLSEQERVQRMYDLQIAQKQQLLQDQYRREQEENQRRNTDQPPNLNFNENSNRRRLDEERAREYQEHLAKQQPLSFRGKEPTPENLRQGFPIDHSKQDEQKRKLINERQKEYNELLQKNGQAPIPDVVQARLQAEGEARYRADIEANNVPYQTGPVAAKTAPSVYQPGVTEKQQQQSKNRRAEVLEGTGATLPVGEYDDRRKQQLADERHNEFLRQQQEKQQQQSNGRRADVLEGTGATLPVGEYDDRRKQQLADERHNEFLRQQQQKLDSERRTGLPPKPPTPNHFFNTIGQHEKTQQALNEERKKEYNQRPQARGRTGARTEQQENLASLPIKGHDSAEVKKPTPSEGYLFNFSLPWFERSRSYCDIKPYSLRKVKARNDEYNDFLHEKRYRDAHRLDHKKPATAATDRHSVPTSPTGRSPRGPPPDQATLPGLGNSDSAEVRKVRERNREYNEYLQKKGPKGVRRGWSTPTYEEILDQKRRDENRRRQEEDQAFGAPRMRGYASDGALNKLEDNLRDRHLEKEFEARKVRFDDERNLNRGILEDDNWLNPGRREQEYQQLMHKMGDDQAAPEARLEAPVVDQAPDMAARVQNQGQYLASLNIGAVPGLGVGSERTDSAKRRVKAQYNRDLRIQMQDAQDGKLREKRHGLPVNASGYLDPEKSSTRIRGLGDIGGQSPRREYKTRDVEPYHSRILKADSDARQGRPSGGFDALGHGLGHGLRDFGNLEGPRSSSVPPFGGLTSESLGGIGLGPSGPPSAGLSSLRGILSNNRRPPSPEVDFGDNFQVPLERGRRRERDPGLNDLGFTGLLESRRNVGAVAPPPGLLYQPSTYVTGGTGIGGVNSSIDEAYHYLGLKNPLDVADNGPGFSGGYGGGGGGGGGGGVPNLNLGGDFGGGGGYRGSPTPRVTFADEPVSYRKRDRSKERISPYQFPSDEDTRSRSRTDTQSYAQELERQIAEKRMAKQREREKQERYDQKLEEEIKNYNPFGRGGGGAPIKDGAGNAVADLRALQRGGESSRRVSPITVSHAQYSDRPPSPSDDKYRPPPAQNNALGEGTYARGGHGIFGHPKTESEKDASDKYKDDLRLQIEDKRRRAAMEKQKEKEEEDKENRRLEEQRQKIQNEYEEDQRKIRAREEEARKRNEEMKQAADNRKKEAQRQRQEQDDVRMKEQQEQIERERQERQREADRVKSPPVPAMKAKTDDRVANSPPLPAHRGDRERSANSQRSQRSYRAQPSPAAGPSQDRPNSSDVLTQLASMRKQLQSERRRVENALENSKNEPDVFDPRTIQRPPPTKLVFENAVNKNASLIPPKTQTSDSPNTRNLQQFNELKFKSDSDSRRNFRSLFPEAPITNNTLEAQQDAMIRQQEEMLRGMKERSYRPRSAPIFPKAPEIKIIAERSDMISLDSDQYEPSPASVNLGYGRHGNVSARSQLASNSAFIDVDALNSFPEDFDDMAGVRNNSARARRRDRYSPRVPSVNGYGSQASLDVDRIQRKNDDRLRKLQNMTTVNRNHYGGDDVSLTDPDDILDRFMTKQTHNRPPSGQTLQDDSWLRPGSLAL